VAGETFTVLSVWRLAGATAADREGSMTEILVEVRPANVNGDIARRRPAVPESFASRAGEIADTLTEVAGELRKRLEANMAAEEAEESHPWCLTTVELGSSWLFRRKRAW